MMCKNVCGNQSRPGLTMCNQCLGPERTKWLDELFVDIETRMDVLEAGRQGGKASAFKLTNAQRKTRAVKAARARWEKEKT